MGSLGCPQLQEALPETADLLIPPLASDDKHRLMHTPARSSFLARHTPTNLSSHTTHQDLHCSLGSSHICPLLVRCLEPLAYNNPLALLTSAHPSGLISKNHFFQEAFTDTQRGQALLLCLMALCAFPSFHHFLCVCPFEMSVCPITPHASQGQGPHH